ncbi:MAG: phosphoglycerate kinase [Patescibacteria group bacterium]
MKFLSSLSKNDIFDKTCLLRVDLNIEDEALRNFKKNEIPLRLMAIFPTIKFLIERGAKVLILSHRGRQKQICLKKDEKSCKNEFSLEPYSEIISKKIGQGVHFIGFKSSDLNELFFKNLSEFVKKSPNGEVFILENLRFSPEEEENSSQFARKLAALGNFYVNDAFSVSHRKNASVTAITKFLPSYAGMILEKEIKMLSNALKKPKKPLVIILGGGKVPDKMGLIENFLDKADYFLVGGGIANTFLAAQDLPVGDSLYESKMIPIAKKFLESGKIILPADVAISGRKILDIGPQTIKDYSKIISKAKTIIWNGPLGYFEDERYAKGSKAIAKAIIKSKAHSIIGGGETTTLLGKINKKSTKVFLSTGGGAMLEYLAGKKLPGIEVLK